MMTSLQVDSDGSGVGFSALVQAIFEFIQSLTERKKYKNMIRYIDQHLTLLHISSSFAPSHTPAPPPPPSVSHTPVSHTPVSHTPLSSPSHPLTHPSHPHRKVLPDVVFYLITYLQLPNVQVRLPCEGVRAYYFIF